MLNIFKKSSEYTQAKDCAIKTLSECITDLDTLVKQKCYKLGSRICVCDDDVMSLDDVSGMIRSWGYRVAKVSNADSFVQLLRDNDIGMLVTELRIPGTDVLKVISSLVKYDVPVIVVTQLSVNEPEMSVLNNVEVPIFHKPVDKDVLRDAIKLHYGVPRHTDERKVPR